MHRKASAAATALAATLLAAALPAAADELGTETGTAEETPPGVLGKLAGSSVTLGHHATATSFYKGAEPDYNPVVTQTIEISPRYRVSEKIAVSAVLGIGTELTDSDVTTRRREPLLGDLGITGSYRLPKLPAEIGGSLSLTVTVPTSKESIARRRVLGGGLGTSFQRPFKLAKHVIVAPTVGLRGSAWAATATSLQYDAIPIEGCPDTDVYCIPLGQSPGRSSWATLQESVGVSAELPWKLSAMVNVVWAQSRLYQLSDATYGDIIDGPTADEGVIPVSDTNVNWRYMNIYVLGLDWQAHKKVSVGLGVQTAQPQQKPDSTYYRPFFNRNTQVFGTISVVL